MNKMYSPETFILPSSAVMIVKYDNNLRQQTIVNDLNKIYYLYPNAKKIHIYIDVDYIKNTAKQGFKWYRFEKFIREIFRSISIYLFTQLQHKKKKIYIHYYNQFISYELDLSNKYKSLLIDLSKTYGIKIIYSLDTDKYCFGKSDLGDFNKYLFVYYTPYLAYGFASKLMVQHLSDIEFSMDK